MTIRTAHEDLVDGTTGSRVTRTSALVPAHTLPAQANVARATEASTETPVGAGLSNGVAFLVTRTATGLVHLIGVAELLTCVIVLTLSIGHASSVDPGVAFLTEAATFAAARTTSGRTATFLTGPSTGAVLLISTARRFPHNDIFEEEKDDGGIK